MTRLYQKKHTKYKHINLEERIEIEIGLGRGESISSIARRLYRAKSSVFYEIRRGIYNGRYRSGVSDNSSDNSVESRLLKSLGDNTKLIIKFGKQGTAFRYGFQEELNRGYHGIITIDGNNKDSVEDIPSFIRLLDNRYDFIQGSRFMKGGSHKNTPLFRLVSNKLILIPLVRLLSHYPYTEVASSFRGMSRKFLTLEKLGIDRDCFIGYELLWYISVMAPKLGMRVTEIPIKRNYPVGKVPTKITWKRCFGIIIQLIKLTIGYYKIE